MKLFVLGTGGREQALIMRLLKDKEVSQVYGTFGLGGGSDLPLLSVENAEQVAEECLEKKIDLVIIGPEAFLAQGYADVFRARGLHVFGPGKIASELETSKIFAKKFMKAHGVKTAAYVEALGAQDAFYKLLHLPWKESGRGVVVKYDGLAAGKGVAVCDSVDEARQVILEFEERYGKDLALVLEQRLHGKEVSLLSFVDASGATTLPEAQDYKRIFDQDLGPNTGGMGARSPVPWFSESHRKRVFDLILIPTLRGLREQNIDYRGVLYLGVLFEDEEPYLLEYNVRFGDPETQVIVPRIAGSLAQRLLLCAKDQLSTSHVSSSSDRNGLTLMSMPTSLNHCVNVVLAAEGYPLSPTLGDPIYGLGKASTLATVLQSGTREENGEVVTHGGRVISVVGEGTTSGEAKQRAYEAISHISFRGMHYRRDIGA